MQYLADVAVLSVARDRYIAAVEGHAIAAEEEAILQAEEDASASMPRSMTSANSFLNTASSKTCGLINLIMDPYSVK